MGRFILGVKVPKLLNMMVAMGGMYPALDATAGEPERSTWETMRNICACRDPIRYGRYVDFFGRHNLKALRDGPITWPQGR